MSTKHQGHFARKRFGQNFLVDQGVIDSIVDVIAPKRGERMVEIGPGLAALTEPLIARLATPESPLHAVELDRDLIGRLEKRFGDRLVVHSADALDFDFASLALEGEDNEKPTLRIVGNLPYNISSPLLFHLTTFAHKVIDQHFMLQDEVVDRMIAEPASKDYGRLSVMLQYRYVMDKLLDVPPQSFNPPPKVNSAIVRMIPFAPHELPEVDETVLSDVVKAAFAQRRKVLRNNLGAYRDTIDFDALGFDLTRRAEEVPVAEFVALAQAVQRAKV
ncbi:MULTISPECIES: 16S rRNA (adenine(1518)-N(6)/adenine(1519)-N(6))-dimethyltransferase RsmA [unclassified Caballeronia]|jgi:16S rRNA (adenine1518-N6/adenine1519-N6)-dimethyltransferase|uniref:16S rRNA (adenine(1518)-N(6)/adenine(1519)-N(6))- dimethyltransferase RsmA n=1 Tax=unclassified Caballeronia TaxID=2646786 RepID=UPI0020295FEC|nr:MULTISPECIES: 16S rRNA (adenine(1518)-N(6)/adenine(1519)-N(6))-dimethyltransferase RsmA [unclassified Caballeronia]